MVEGFAEKAKAVVAERDSKMWVYDEARNVPKEAQKSIQAGRLRGMTDINPMWRIKKLTEIFGVCGIGWKYEITNQWIEQGADGEQIAFCNINLYVKDNGEWSAAIPGTGGSTFVAKEKSGYHNNDECFKMALTDAISIACKALGFGANIYWSSDATKYDTGSGSTGSSIRDKLAEIGAEQPKQYMCCDCGKPFADTTTSDGRKYTAGQIFHMSESKNTDGKARCGACMKKAGTEKKTK